MDASGASERMPAGANERGLWRLMLKLPAIRGQLQVLAPRRESLRGLCEAYEDASTMLERLRNKPGEDHCPLVKEYETVCAEIETDVIQYCLEHR